MVKTDKTIIAILDKIRAFQQQKEAFQQQKKLSLLSLLSLKPSQQEWQEGVVMNTTCFLALF